MPTTTIALSDSKVYQNGTFYNSSFNGRSAYLFWSLQPQIDLSFNGTDLSFDYNTNGPTSGLVIRIDGTEYTPTLTANSWTTLSLSSLTTISEGTHIVSIQDRSGQFKGIDAVGFTITGASPILNTIVGLGTVHPFQSAGSMNAGFDNEGGWTYSNGDGVGVTPDARLVLQWNDGAIRFKASITGGKFRVWAIDIRNASNGTTHLERTHACLVIDGQIYQTVSATNPSAEGSNSWAGFDFTIPDSSEHTYLIAFSNGQASNQIHSIQFTGSLNTSPSFVTRNKALFFGDSLTQAIVKNTVDITGHDSTFGFAFKTATAINMACYNRGIGGTAVSSAYSSTNSGQSRVVALAALEFYIAFVLYGTNDIGVAGRSAAQLQTDYTAMVSDAIDNSTATNWYFSSLIHRVEKTDLQMSDANTAISTAVSAKGSGRAHFYESGIWGLNGSKSPGGAGGTNYTDYFVDDHLHINDDGFNLITSNLVSNFGGSPNKRFPVISRSLSQQINLNHPIFNS